MALSTLASGNIQKINNLLDFKIACAADAELYKAVGLLEEFKVRNGKAYGDFAELLRNPDIGKLKIKFSLNLNFSDVIFIDLSNDAHITWILKAIEAGKNVVCEKPLAINAKQVRLVVEKARVSGKFLMEVSGFKSLQFKSPKFLSPSGAAFSLRGLKSRKL